MRKILPLLLIIFASCSQITEINDFETCLGVTGTVLESYPRQCVYDGQTFVEIIDEEPVICTQQYEPVCAEVEVQCEIKPCYPVKQTFGNECMAKGHKILYEGECVGEGKESLPDN